MLLVRLLIASLAIVEGALKFLEPLELGAGRFARLGLPNPHLLAGIVGTTELLCGALVVVGLLTRAACVPLVVIKLFALARAKWPLMASDGFWTMAYEARVDVALLLAAAALLVGGAGTWSVDNWLRRRQSS
jgi:uncharacterized membrane protein YphA (DoxX/SURF4 family)